MGDELSDVERDILAMEKSWSHSAHTRDQAIRQQLHMTPTMYYLILGRMLDDERVWRAEPALVGRLRSLRDDRLAQWRPDHS